MNKLKTFAILITCLLALTIVSCDALAGPRAPGSGGPGGNNNPTPISFTSTDTGGNTYTFIITPTEADTIQANDSYKLTIKVGQTTRESTGSITFVTSSGALTLKPTVSGSQTFTINVTESGQMTNISGSIAVS